jgi:hypothetical protein
MIWRKDREHVKLCADCKHADLWFAVKIGDQMPKIPPAAKVLMKQVQELRPEVRITPTDIIDGFGVQREFLVDTDSAEWLGQILDLNDDPRIKTLDLREDGLLIAFASDSSADRTNPFLLREVDVILNSPEPDEGEGAGEEVAEPPSIPFEPRPWRESEESDLDLG